MEIVDIINENDEVIGQASRKDADNDPNLMHRTVHFTLINPKKKSILITQRSFSKKNDAGKYCFLGEHLVSGEKYNDAVVRGVKEELGIDINEIKELSQNVFEYDSQRELVKFYVGISDGIVSFDEREIEQAQWLSVEELIDSDLDISDMTKYWIQNVNWSQLFSRGK